MTHSKQYKTLKSAGVPNKFISYKKIMKHSLIACFVLHCLSKNL